MKITTILLGTLCLLCLCIPGNVLLEAQQTTSIKVSVPNSSTLLQSWRPSADTSLTFEIKVTVPADFSSGTLTASLQNVTNYLGISGNAVNTTQDLMDPDLQIRKTDGWIQNESTFAYSLSANTNTISLCVDCLDYAAYGELVLTASGSGYTSNTVTVQIPKDTNGNKIADSWQNDATVNYGRDDDNDTGPNTRKGDNITVINEYRGYHSNGSSNGSWTDTDPNAWDIFVKLDPVLAGLGCGISDAYALPMNVHEAPWVSMGDGRVFSHEIEASGGTVPSVYAVRVQGNAADVAKPGDEDYPNDALGTSSIGPPWSNSQVTIYYNRVDYYMDKGIFINDKTLEVDYLNAAIAHEIGHAVNLWHCPCADDLDCYMWGSPDEVLHRVSGFASHHNDDYNLVFDGYFWPRKEADNYPDRIYVQGVGIRERKVEDVDGDGVVNASDLVIVALNFGTSVPHIANVNGDNAVNILDLVRVANAMTTTGSVCFTSLREDVNADGVVNISDLVLVASKIGSNRVNNVIAEDVDANGSVNETDLDLVAAAFGNTVATTTTTTTTTTPTTTTQTFDPSLSGNASTYSPGSTLSVTVSTSGAPIYGARLYRGSTDVSGWVSGSKTTTSLDFSYTFPTNATGSYSFRVSLWPWDGNTYGTVERLYFTVNIQSGEQGR